MQETKGRLSDPCADLYRLIGLAAPSEAQYAQLKNILSDKQSFAALNPDWPFVHARVRDRGMFEVSGQCDWDGI